MFCPECGSEYREGFRRCSDCDCDLVWQLPEGRDIKLIKVFESNNPALVTLVKSLLNDAAIEFTVDNELSFDAYSYGNTTVEFLVSENDVDAANELLLELRDGKK